MSYTFNSFVSDTGLRLYPRDSVKRDIFQFIRFWYILRLCLWLSLFSLLSIHSFLIQVGEAWGSRFGRTTFNSFVSDTRLTCFLATLSAFLISFNSFVSDTQPLWNLAFDRFIFQFIRFWYQRLEEFGRAMKESFQFIRFWYPRHDAVPLQRVSPPFNSFVSDTFAEANTVIVTLKNFQFIRFWYVSAWRRIRKAYAYNFQFIRFWYQSSSRRSGRWASKSFNSFVSDTGSGQAGGVVVAPWAFNSFVSDTRFLKASVEEEVSDFQFIRFWYLVVIGIGMTCRWSPFNSFVSDTTLIFTRSRFTRQNLSIHSFLILDRN